MKENAFKKEMSEEEILSKISEDASNTSRFNTGISYLRYKLQQNLLNNQNEQNKAMLEVQNTYNNKQLSYSRNLIYATWALVLATIVVAIITFVGK